MTVQIKATRDAFGDHLPFLFQKHKNLIALDADLGKATKISSVLTDFPTRYFQMGIAEANMIGVAAGMSQHGYIPIIASFASFLTGRYDTIRCSIAYPNCPVVMVGTHGGLAIGRDGVTQMGLEDMALMRALPNIKIYNPATYTDTINTLNQIFDEQVKGPVYLRLGRQPIPDISLTEKDTFYTDYSKQGVYVFTTGCIYPEVVKAAKLLEEYNIHIKLRHINRVKPLNINTNTMVLKDSLIFTIEDHSIIGGLGSAILEHLQTTRTNIIRIGLQDVFPESGAPEDLYKKYQLDAESIKNTILTNVIRHYQRRIDNLL